VLDKIANYFLWGDKPNDDPLASDRKMMKALLL
jgi:hypothetical protein